MGLHFNYDAFRQVCVVSLLEEYLQRPGVRIINIGDGYGFLSALIKDQYGEHLLDEVCPWCLFFFSFHRAQYGPGIANIRLPFVNYFDGIIRDRLTKLNLY